MRSCSIGIVFALAALNIAAAQVRAGAAKGPVTPHSQVWLAGSSGRTHATESPSGDIFARALAIDDGSGGRVVFLAVELLAIPRTLAERVAADLMRAHGLDRGQIVINASGTHSAPFVQGLHPAISPASTAEQRIIAAYTGEVARTLIDIATAALANMQPARLSFSSGDASFAVNAPLRVAADFSDSGGSVDTTVPVLRVATVNGDMIAVLFGYACRNAVLDAGSYAIVGDYAGVAASSIEKQFPGSVALFLRLCDGGQSPAPRGSETLVNRHGAALAAEVTRVLRTTMQPVSGRLRATLIETSLPFAPHTREQFESEAKSGNLALARRAKLLLAAYDARVEPRQLPYAVQAVRFACGFALVALAGEPDVSYALKIRKMLGQEGLIVAGGSNDGGYVVPVAGAHGSGDADFADSIVDSGFPGPFTDEAEQRVLDAVGRAWKRVGR